MGAQAAGLSRFRRFLIDGERPRDRRLARAAPFFLLIAFVVAFDPQLRPGRTVIPIDVLNFVEPWGVYDGSPPQNGILLDTVTQTYEWAEDFHRRVRAGDVPTWQPLIAGGVPYVPNGAIAVHYPPTWLFGLLPTGTAFTVFMVLHFWLAGLGMWLWLRRLGASVEASLFGGFAYAMSGLVHNWSFGPPNITALALAPFVFYGIERCVTSPSPRSASVLGLTAGMILLGGNPQFAYHVAIAGVVYALVRLVTAVGFRKALIASSCALGAGAVLGLLLGAAEILPGLAASSSIVRKSGSLGITTTAPIEHLVRLAVPDFFSDPVRLREWRGNAELWMNSPYIGLLPAALAAMVIFRVRDRRVAAVAAIAVVGGLFALSPPVHDLAAGVIPFWSRFRVSVRWLSMANLGATALAGLGADALLRSARRRPVRGAAAASALLIALPFIHMVVERPKIPSGYLGPELTTLAVIALVSAVGLVLALRRARAWILLGLGAELMLIFAPYFPVHTRRELHNYASIPELRRLTELPEGRSARLQAPTNTPRLTHNSLMLVGRADAQGLSVFLPARYVKFLSLIEDHSEFTALSNEIGSFVSPASFVTPLARMAGVRYAIAPRASDGPPGWTIAHDGILRIFADPSPLPDAWIAQPVSAPGGNLPRALSSPDFDPLRSAFVEGRSATAGPAGRSSVTVIRRGADRVLLETDSEGPGELVQPIGYHEGWRATVDGTPGRTEPVNMAFLGVPIPGGRHHVELLFDPSPVKAGRLISLAALLASAILASGVWLGGRRSASTRQARPPERDGRATPTPFPRPGPGRR